MRALLINPWIYDFAAYDLWSKPIGLLTIASHLKNTGWDISLIDCLDRFDHELEQYLGKSAHTTTFGNGHYHSEEIEKPALFEKLPRKFKRYGFPLELFLQKLKREPKPDIILVTTGMTYWYPSYIDTIKILKEHFPDTPVMLGGIYAGLCYEHACKNTGADLVFKGSNIHKILLEIHRLSGKGTVENISKISEHGYPDYTLYSTLPYATIRTSRGCPFRCTYCGWYHLDDSYSRADAENIVTYIEYLNKKMNIKNFSFYDDALLYDAENHIIKILEGILEKKIYANFHTPNGLHNRFMTHHIAQLFRKCGFMQPRLALETISEIKQKETGSKTTNEDFLKAVSYLRQAGYGSGEIGAYVLIGLPEQKIQEVEDTVRFAAEHKIRIFLEEYSPIPGTPDYIKSGLPENADPLKHNNSSFPLHSPEQSQKYQKMKEQVSTLNKRH